MGPWMMQTETDTVRLMRGSWSYWEPVRYDECYHGDRDGELRKQDRTVKDDATEDSIAAR